ncbi:tRNA 2-thiocytidine(32) synthetase TtcA [Methyloterricola oryzae]|uniref:tRNA 2-thiocytidine(32) synthetase TtcA n=1 Tax=Methyloterricola oryzae TaxID=1495050 RepID=UPI0009E3C97C|nr:tRNA 2-thiocytidine(32) synthetase TtcA [Methyloterricola oryzae]
MSSTPRAAPEAVQEPAPEFPVTIARRAPRSGGEPGRPQGAGAQLSEKQRYEFNKCHKRLRRLVGEAIADYRMIEDGDKVMVCLSGGKDSYTLLDILLSLRLNAPIHFDIVAVNLDQKQPGFPAQVLPEYLEGLGIPYHVIEQDTYSIVKRVVPEGKTTCGLCSRLRRGLLYRYAGENGVTKIALGHHRDDILETFFLNLFYGGTLKAMPPKLLSDDRRHIVIRPLAYCKEKDIEAYARVRDFPIIPCNLCGSQANLQRQAMKEMMKGWQKQHPGRLETIFTALQNVAPSQLADTKLFDFSDLEALRDASERAASSPDGLDILTL